MAVTATQLYHRNLSALKAFQPQVGDLVQEKVIPEAIVPAKGRDGSDTFLLPGKNGRGEWFGGSSMPTISAGEVFAELRREAGNVWLPGILTGQEPLEVARRIPNHCAVFVLETSPLAIKLALHIHDYTELLAAGRLVLMFVHRLEDDVRQFFQDYPGYEQPMHLLTVPQVSAGQLSDLQRQVEKAAQTVIQIQTRILEASVQAIHARTLRAPASTPRVAVLSVDPTPASVEQSARIARALTELGWPHEVCVPDAPGKCHITARIRAVERLRADWILFVGDGGRWLRPLLPLDLPIASWYPPGCAAPPVHQKEIGPRDRVFAASCPARQAMIASGVPVDRIELCEPAADDTVFRPIDSKPDGRRGPTADLVVLMDLPDDRPEASGITVTSHVALWRALQGVASRLSDQYQPSRAGDWLDEAQQLSGVALREKEVRERFLALIRARIAPVAIGRAAVRAVLDTGCHVAAWGTNWPDDADERIVLGGAIPVGAVLNGLFNNAGIVVLPGGVDRWIQVGLDALAAGASVICRAGERAFAADYPQLAALEPFLHIYRTGAELASNVRYLSSESGTRSKQTDTADQMIRGGHTVAHRLRMIAERLHRTRAILDVNKAVLSGVKNGA